MRGSQPGERRGGRQKGTPNKVTATREAEIAASGLTPLDYMMSILRADDAPADLRFEAAKAAAPYCHPKLQAMTLAGDPDKPLKVDMSDLEAARRLAFLMTKAAGNAA